MILSSLLPVIGLIARRWFIINHRYPDSYRAAQDCKYKQSNDNPSTTGNTECQRIHG
jgi:hypothetical protein